MGSWIEFTCEKYGYRAEVSGGKDCGMRLIRTETREPSFYTGPYKHRYLLIAGRKR